MLQIKRFPVATFVRGLLARHCGPKAADNANTVLHFANAIVTGSATPEEVRRQIVQLAEVVKCMLCCLYLPCSKLTESHCLQTHQMAQHIIHTSPLMRPHNDVHPEAPLEGGDTHTTTSREPMAASGRPHFADRSGVLPAFPLAGPADDGYGHRQEQREQELEDKMRALELQLQRERDALMKSKPMQMSIAFDEAVQREMRKQTQDDEEQRRLMQDLKTEETQEDELIRRFTLQALEDGRKSDEQQLGELARQQQREDAEAEAMRQKELEIERKIALLQQQIAAEKARAAGPALRLFTPFTMHTETQSG